MGCVATRASPSLRHETRHTQRSSPCLFLCETRCLLELQHNDVTSFVLPGSSLPFCQFGSTLSSRSFSLPSCSVCSARSYYATRVFTDFGLTTRQHPGRACFLEIEAGNERSFLSGISREFHLSVSSPGLHSPRGGIRMKRTKRCLRLFRFPVGLKCFRRNATRIR